MSIAETFEDGSRRAQLAGSSYVDATHVSQAQLDELADDALTFLRGRSGQPSSIAGWTRVAASQAGLLPYWARLAGWTTDAEKKPFRPLRKDVYDLLEKRGLIRKPPGQGSPIDVSTAGLDVRYADTEIRSRIERLVQRIALETDIDAEDYRTIAGEEQPAVVLARILLSRTTSQTTKLLSSRQRLDLSIEQATLTWQSDLPISSDLVESARERLAYWSST